MSKLELFEEMDRNGWSEFPDDVSTNERAYEMAVLFLREIDSEVELQEAVSNAVELGFEKKQMVDELYKTPVNVFLERLILPNLPVAVSYEFNAQYQKWREIQADIAASEAPRKRAITPMTEKQHDDAERARDALSDASTYY